MFSEKNECSGTVTADEQGEKIVIVDSDIMMWHNKFEHMSEKGVKLIHSKKVLPSLKCVNMDFFEICVYGKQKRVSFVKIGKENKSEKLELVHAYKCMGTRSGIFSWWLSLLCYIY